MRKLSLFVGDEIWRRFDEKANVNSYPNRDIIPAERAAGAVISREGFSISEQFSPSKKGASVLPTFCALGVTVLDMKCLLVNAVSVS